MHSLGNNSLLCCVSGVGEAGINDLTVIQICSPYYPPPGYPLHMYAKVCINSLNIPIVIYGLSRS